MVLNYIWIAFFLISFILGLLQWIIGGNMEIFPNMLNATFEYAKTGFEISLGLTGVLALWLGFLKIAEEAGLIKILSRFLGPFLHPLFPEIPKNHPVFGTMVMNFSANMLGLDNAATPIGLKTMEGLQDLNEDKEKASNSQIMFLVLNTSGLTIIPINIMVYRSQMGAENPADIFLPILIATFMSTLGGIIFVGIKQRLNFLNVYLLSALAGISLLIFSLLYFLSFASPQEIESISSQLSSLIIFSLIVLFISFGVYKKINVYETFINGAKEGFNVAIKIIPYLIAILVAIGVFRSSGGMELFIGSLQSAMEYFSLPGEYIPSLPTALLKPLSGSASRSMMIDAMNTYGADSFTGKLSSTLQGSTETTFYVIALYFGSVGIKKTRYAIAGGLFADVIGIITAILVAYLFFA